jgi:hypothetical protein
MTTTHPKPYTPRAGSLPEGVIEALFNMPRGQQRMLQRQIAEVFEVHTKNIPPVMVAAVKHGALLKYKDPNSRQTGYCLPGSEGAPTAPSLREELAANNAPGLRPRAEKQPAPRIPTSVLQFTRWHDDDIGISGATVAEDGTVLFTPADIRALVQFICHSAGTYGLSAFSAVGVA